MKTSKPKEDMTEIKITNKQMREAIKKAAFESTQEQVKVLKDAGYDFEPQTYPKHTQEIMETDIPRAPSGWVMDKEKLFINKFTGKEVKPFEWTVWDVLKGFVIGFIIGAIIYYKFIK